MLIGNKKETPKETEQLVKKIELMQNKRNGVLKKVRKLFLGLPNGMVISILDNLKFEVSISEKEQPFIKIPEGTVASTYS